MPTAAPETVADKPFVATSVARLLMSRLTLTHEDRAISVMSGPWGIGKTTALDAFQAKHPDSCVIVKVRPGARDRPATAVAVLQLAVEALREQHTIRPQVTLGTTAYALRRLFHDYLSEWEPYRTSRWSSETEALPPFTFIFDEAQYLSREAIDTLRYWNDPDRPDGPFPVGLFFVGNPELSLAGGVSRDSVLSGAVRSRALFVEALAYHDITDADLLLFAQSRGLTNPAGLDTFIAHFRTTRVTRDLRGAERLLASINRRAAGNAITADLVRTILNP